MKKLFSLLVVLIAVCASAWADDPVISVSGEVIKGGEGFITLSIECNGVQVRDMQCDIILPQGFVFSEDENGKTKVSYHEDVQSSDYRAGINDEDNATYTASPRRRVVFNSTTGVLLKDGPFLDIFIKEVNSEIEIGETTTGTVTGSNEPNGDKFITISCQGGVTVHQEDADIPIDVWGAILDEENTTKFDDYDGTGVLVKRTIKVGVWSTICLPFALSNEQIKEKFGEDVDLAEFNGITYKNDDKDMTIKFKRVDEMKANNPYIIKLGSDITEDIKSFSFINETLDITYDEMPYVEVNEEYFVGVPIVTSFKGNKLQNNHPIYLSSNKFYYLKHNAELTLKGFRAYILCSHIGSFVSKNPANVNFFVDDDVIDGIDGIMSNKVVEGVYDLQGRKVNDEHLKRGVYIIDGKKVVVK